MSWLDDLERCPTTGKLMHRKKSGALAQYRMLKNAGKGDLRIAPYLCWFCKHWHLGHPARKPRTLFNADGEHQLRNTLAYGRRNTSQANRKRRR